MREKTLHVLEYDKIIEMLKDRASSEMTKKVISELEPVCDARLIKEKQEETTEAVKLISAKGPLPVGGFYDVAGLAGFTRKGGVLVSLGGPVQDNNGLLLEAHVDTMGGMVAEVKASGRLRLTNLGGMNPNNAETEIVRIVTKSGKIYEGTFQLCNASLHVNKEYGFKCFLTTDDKHIA